jgi:hypothetical protein
LMLVIKKQNKLRFAPSENNGLYENVREWEWICLVYKCMCMFIEHWYKNCIPENIQYCRFFYFYWNQFSLVDRKCVSDLCWFINF